MQIAKPWNLIEVPDEVYSPKGMIGPEERRALYWLGQNYYSGQGAIVDAGALVGCSAFCLAAGLVHNNAVQLGRPCIFSFDYFKAFDHYVAEYISKEFYPIGVNSDYIDIFLRQTQKYSAFICPQQGNFIESKWTFGPIEILFIDIAKSQELNSHVIREFFAHLIPGRAIVMHQDFYHCWHPYIHITMEALSPYFEVIDRHVKYQSRLYLYKRVIPEAELHKVADYRYAAEERLTFLDTFAAAETGDMRGMAQVIKLWQLVLDGNYTAVRTTYDAIKGEHGQIKEKSLWWQQACQVMASFEANDIIRTAATKQGQ